MSIISAFPSADAAGGGLTQEQADERYLQLNGGTMAGPIVFSIADQFQGQLKAPDSFDEYSIRLSGGAGISAGRTVYKPSISFWKYGNQISNDWEIIVEGVKTPHKNNHAANKQYVDTAIAAAITGAIEGAY